MLLIFLEYEPYEGMGPQKRLSQYIKSGKGYSATTSSQLPPWVYNNYTNCENNYTLPGFFWGYLSTILTFKLFRMRPGKGFHHGKVFANDPFP
jgi:hypothetical protein